MREIPKKNYIKLVILIVATIIVTISLSKMYLSDAKAYTKFYEYCNKMDNNELDYINIENSYLIVYIADKYDKSYNNFEKKFKNEIEKYNLEENIVFLDRDSADEEFFKNIEKKYNVKIDRNKLDKNMILEFLDQELVNIVYVEKNSDASMIINYEDLK